MFAALATAAAKNAKRLSTAALASKGKVVPVSEQPTSAPVPQAAETAAHAAAQVCVNKPTHHASAPQWLTA